MVFTEEFLNTEFENGFESHGRDFRYKQYRKQEDFGFIYLLKSENGKYKIGRTTQPVSRIKQIQSNTPFKIQLVHLFEVRKARKIEKEIHAIFKEFLIAGEWFELPPSAVREFIRLGNIFSEGGASK